MRTKPSGIAFGINDLGHIVVTADFYDFPPLPFFWHDGRIAPLPLPPGEQAASANSINNRDQVVGITGSNTPRALLWQAGSVFDLTDLVSPQDPGKPYVALQDGEEINNHGQILAVGADSRLPGQTVFFLLTPGN